MIKKRSLQKDDNPNARLQGPLPISSRAADTILHKNFLNDRRLIELYWRIDGFALDNGNVKGPFSARLAFDNGWTADHTDRIIGDYKHCLSLLISAGHKLGPSDAVVRAWYRPMIHFRSYWDEPCEKTSATKLHYKPIEGEPGHQAHRSCAPHHLKRSPSDLVHKIPLITGKSAFKFLSINLFSKLNGVTAMSNTAMSPLSDVISGTNCDLQHKVRAHRRSSSYGYQLLSLAFILIVGAQSFTAGAATFEGPISGEGGNCLTVTGGNLSNGNDVTMRRCTGSWTQQWQIDDLNGLIKVKGENKCLALEENRTEAQTDVEIQDCRNLLPYQWSATTDSNGYTQIQNMFSLLCLDVTAGGTTEGTPVWMHACAESVAQRWVLAEWIGPIVGKGGKCLTVPNSDYSDGSDLYMYTCHGWSSQQWTVSKDRIRINGNRKCLDIENGSTDSEALVQIWDCEEVPQQIWSFTDQGEIKSAVTDETCLDVDSVESGPDNTPNKSQVWMYKCNQSKPQGWFAGKKPVHVPFTGSQVTAFEGAVKALLEDCKGMLEFQDKTTKAWVVVMKNPTPYVVERNTDGFKDAARVTRRGEFRNRVVINGGWFLNEGENGILDHLGDIVEDRIRTHDNPLPDFYEGFYISFNRGNSSCGGQWAIGPSDAPLKGAPPPLATFAIGGARPLVINGIRWGRSPDFEHRYFVDTYPDGFNDMDAKAFGKPTLGLRGDLVMLIVQENDEIPPTHGMTLTEVRDTYTRLKFNNALLWDPSTSATLVVNESVRANPLNASLLGNKDQQIPVGLGFGTQ